MSEEEKRQVLSRLAEALEEIGGLSFAYAHGSFLQGDFEDVDVAAYFYERPDSRVLVGMELQVEKEIGLPVDLQSLNGAPLAFAHGVIAHGKLLVERDELARMDYEERIRDFYFDFEPFLRRYLNEVVYGRHSSE